MADWRAFYQRFDAAHREWISALVADWREAGQIVELSEAADALHFRARSALGGRPTLAVVDRDARLAPRLSFPVERWRRMLGEEEAERLLDAMAALDGLTPTITREAWIVPRPAHLPPPTQKRLRDWFLALAHRLREIAPR